MMNISFRMAFVWATASAGPVVNTQGDPGIIERFED